MESDKSIYINVFLRSLGLIFLLVFVNLWIFYSPLIGSSGLLPTDQTKELASANSGFLAFFSYPSLIWFSHSDIWSYALIISGIIASTGLIWLRWTTLWTFLLFMIWLSFVNLGGDFFNYIWDIFLIEIAFLSIFLSLYKPNPKMHLVIVAPLLFLYFRMWFSMGMVKVLYNNQPWDDLLYMTWFYPNQPMPSPLAYYVSMAPLWFHKASEIIVILLETVVPFFVFIPRLRKYAFVLFSGLMVLIHLSGNYAYFNILVIVLGFLLFSKLPENKFLKKLVLYASWKPKELFPSINPAKKIREFKGRVINRPSFIFFIKGILVLQMTIQLSYCLFLFFPSGNRYLNFLNYYVYSETVKESEAKAPLLKIPTFFVKIAAALRIVNPYGVFKGIAINRWEITFEATLDGKNWEEYKFKYKPGTGNNPMFFAPHFPRFDHQLFYEAQQGSFYRVNNWYHFDQNNHCWIKNLLKSMYSSNRNLHLFKEIPFNGEKPKLVRMKVVRLILGEARSFQKGFSKKHA